MLQFSLLNRAYETERRSWPSNGLRFAEGVLNALSFDSDGGGDALRMSRAHQMLNQQRSDSTSELHRLIGLIESLKVSMGRLYELYQATSGNKCLREEIFQFPFL